MEKHTFETYASVVNDALARLPYPHKPEGLYEPIAYALSAGGKRLRPVLLMLVSDMFGGNTDEALKVGIALETYHNFTLLHDDLMDNADVRRGRPTVHKQWDANTAILSGDNMLVMAYQRLLDAASPAQDELLSLFTRTAMLVDEGQQYDMNFESRNDVSVEEYMEMIRLKTGALIACAAKMGALVGKASAADADKLYAFGESLGIAFQLQDDYLDVYGDTAVFGKQTGGDIANNKKTYLLIQALLHAKGETRAALDKWLSAKQFNRDEKVKAVTDIYDSLGIGRLTQQAIDKRFIECGQLLDEVNVENERKQEVRRFASVLMGRKF